VNFLVFQAVYFACVLGAARGAPGLGPLVAVVLLPVNLVFVADRARELRLWMLAGAVGLALDSALLAAGLIDFPAAARLAPDAGWPHALVPLWILTLWVAFGSLLTSSLAWLGGSVAAAVVFGAVGGPLSFWSGSRLGATELPRDWASFLALGLEYAVLLPILLRVAARGDGGPAPAAESPAAPTDAASSPTASR
jgi:hypothetical protein